MLKKTNKKGFTLIELIIVVAIMAVLVALLAPNVLKYLEKSKVSKDMNSLDAVRSAFNAEIMDEDLSDYCTDATYGTASDNKLGGVFLYEYENATEGQELLLNQRIWGYSVLGDIFYKNEVFASKAAKDGCIKVFLDGKGGIAVVAITADGNVAEYDGEKLYVATNLTLEQLDTAGTPAPEGETEEV